MSDDLGPAASEAVIERALEMMDAETSGVHRELSPERVAAIALEVGATPQGTAAALAEYRAGVDPDKSVLDRVIGPRTVWARRRSTVEEAEARENAGSWLQSGGLQPRVRDDGTVVASQRRGVAGRVAVGVRRAAGLGGLGRARKVAVATAEVDDAGAVCVVADIGNQRDVAVLGGTAVAVGGAAVTGVVALVTSPVALVAVPVIGAVSVVGSRMKHQANLRNAVEDVEVVVDGIARGEKPPKLKLPRRRRRS